MSEVWANKDKSGDKHIPVGSLTESEELTRLERQIMDVEMTYEKYAEDNLDFQKDVDRQKDKMSKMNKLFCLALAGACLSPLRKGVNSKSVLRVVGLWVGCCFLSKSFRQECNTVLSKVFYPLMSKKMEGAKADSMLSKRGLVMDECGDTLPLTPDSVAVMKIVFCKQAYARMRETGADVDAILEDYRRASDKLYDLAAADGIRPELVDKSMRKIATDLIDKDSSFLQVFTETAYDTAVRGADMVHRQRYKDGDGVKTRTYTSWEGDYVDTDGNPYVESFTPRNPASVNELRHLSKNAWDNTMASASTPEEWGDVVSTPYARQLQQRYLYFMKVDNHLEDEQLSDLNALMNPDDDVSWLVDMDGEDPFGIGSLDDSFADVVKNGPKPNAEHVILGTYPEFKSAYCKWLNHHEDVSPMAEQVKANAAYYEYAARGKTDDSLLGQVAEHMRTRDALQERWNGVFEDINQRVCEVTSANQQRLKELKRLERPLPGDERVPMMSF